MKSSGRNSQRIEFFFPEDYNPRLVERTPEGWWVIPGDIQQSEWVREKNEIVHDYAFAKWCADWIRYGSVVIDVGANIGTHSVLYLRYRPKRLYCFEPVHSAFECLRLNLLYHIQVGGGTSSIIGFCEAAGDKTRKVSLISDPSIPGCSYVDHTSGETDMIPLGCVVDGDDWNDLSLIKIDAEGCEPLVIEGASMIYPHKGRQWRRPTVIFEVNNLCLERNGWNQVKLFDLLHSLDYTPGGRWPPEYDKLSLQELAEKPQFDMCWVPKESN